MCSKAEHFQIDDILNAFMPFLSNDEQDDLRSFQCNMDQYFSLCFDLQQQIRFLNECKRDPKLSKHVNALQGAHELELETSKKQFVDLIEILTMPLPQARMLPENLRFEIIELLVKSRKSSFCLRNCNIRPQRLEHHRMQESQTEKTGHQIPNKQVDYKLVTFGKVKQESSKPVKSKSPAKQHISFKKTKESYV